MFIDKSMTRNVITIRQEATLLDARAKMDENHIRHLPVVEDKILMGLITELENSKDRERISELKVGDVMTRNPVTISPMNTLEDAIMMMHKMHKGAFPVVDNEGKLTGIISTRDLIRAFINVLGIENPGTLLCIEVEDKLGQMKRIVDAITEEKISFGSILVARHWEEGKRAIFPYLLTNNVVKVKKKLEGMGYTLLNPMEWSLEQLPRNSGTKSG